MTVLCHRDAPRSAVSNDLTLSLYISQSYRWRRVIIFPEPVYRTPRRYRCLYLASFPRIQLKSRCQNGGVFSFRGTRPISWCWITQQLVGMVNLRIPVSKLVRSPVQLCSAGIQISLPQPNPQASHAAALVLPPHKQRSFRVSD